MQFGDTCHLILDNSRGTSDVGIPQRTNSRYHDGLNAAPSPRNARKEPIL